MVCAPTIRHRTPPLHLSFPEGKGNETAVLCFARWKGQYGERESKSPAGLVQREDELALAEGETPDAKPGQVPERKGHGQFETFFVS